MGTWELDTPVAMVVFNRPDHTQRVFEQVAAVEPPALYVIADGPRTPEEEPACEAARNVIDVDWECAVSWNAAGTNLGIRERFTTGLDWLFNHESEAIILEDDCLPAVDFFRYCERLLDRYRMDERVMQISGTNELGTWREAAADYHFSLRGSIWGWATWRRAWKMNRPEMRGWTEPEVRERLREWYCDDGVFRRRARKFDAVHAGEIDTWDYQWNYSRAVNGGLATVPSRNLVSNIGFGEGATHTATETDRSALRRRSLEFPLESPGVVLPDRAFDRAVFERHERGRFERFLPPFLYEFLVDQLP